MKKLVIALVPMIFLASCSTADKSENTTDQSISSSTTMSEHGTDDDSDIDEIDHQTDRSTPEIAVSRAFETAYAYRPGEDKSAQDALKRAAIFFTGDMKKSMVDPESLGIKISANSEIWESWAKSGDIVLSTVEILDSDSTTDTVTAKVLQMVEHSGKISSGIQRWTKLAPFTVKAHLVQDDEGWLIDSYRIVDGSPTY